MNVGEAVGADNRPHPEAAPSWARAASFRSIFASFRGTSFARRSGGQIPAPFSRAESIKLRDGDEKVLGSNVKPSEEDQAGSFSTIFFFFATPLFVSTYRARRNQTIGGREGELQEGDFWGLPRNDAAAVVTRDFEDAYAQAASIKSEVSRVQAGMNGVAARVMLRAAAIKIVNTLLQISYPLLLQRLLIALQPPHQDISAAYGWAAGLGGAMLIKALTENTYFWVTGRAGRRLRVALSSAVYTKSLRLSTAARQTQSIGQIVNLMQLDATKIANFMDQALVLIDGPLQLIGYTIVVWYIIGWSAFVGLAFMMLAVPIQAGVTRRLMTLDRGVVKVTDQRVKVTNESLQGIMGVKLSAWEEAFIKVITDLRGTEVSYMRAGVGLRAFSSAYMSSMPAMTAVVAIAVYVTSQNGNVNAAILFSALSAFNQLRFPLMLFPMALAQLAQALVSRRRLAAFLALPEVSSHRGELPKDGPVAARLEDVVVWWADPAAPPPAAALMTTPPLHAATLAKGVAPASAATNTAPAGAHQSSSPTGAAAAMGPRPALVDVSLTIGRGELIGIVGSVGSGKTALLSTLLGEMHLESGALHVVRPIAYSAQTPWILNATVKDNIVFGSRYDPVKYAACVSACQLERDIEILPQGDNTEIGERGVSLSGGQKARVSCARAAYMDAPLVLLDDPLSALDPEVAARLFDECVLDLMRGRTRIVITNHLDVLKRCDRIVVIGGAGSSAKSTASSTSPTTSSSPRVARITETGTFDELMQAEGEFAALIRRHQQHDDLGRLSPITDDTGTAKASGIESSSGAQQPSALTTTALSPGSGGDRPESRASSTAAAKTASAKPRLPAKATVSLMQAEDRRKGAVTSEVYATYIRAGGGFAWFTLVYAAYVLSQGAAFVNLYWLSLWSAAASAGYPQADRGLTFWIAGYGLTTVVMALSAFIRTGALYIFCIAATSSLHRKLLNSVLHAPTSYFDTTPLGRILQRFSRDIWTLDFETPENIAFFLFTTLFVVTSFGTIVGVTPLFLAVLVPLLGVYVAVLQFYRPLMRDAKRVGSIVTSPVYSQFSETLGGLTSIRAFGVADSFYHKQERLQNALSHMLYALKLAERWLSVRLELIGSAVCLGAACLAVQAVSSGWINAGLAGLSISFGMSTTFLLTSTVRSFANLEAGMNSVERVHDTGTKLPQERWRETDYDPRELVTLAPNWPSQGALEVRSLSLRYRPTTPLVLRNLNFSIAPRERIGIIGRTGSGKSSLLLALIRIVEPESGSVVNLDGVDVSHVPVFELRSRIGVAPQLPVVFSGTVRYNVDPFGKHTDAEVWNALEQARIKAMVRSLPKGLDSPVSEFGENFSQGERQLLSLSRILLRRPALLLLDESTASLDADTDSALQSVIRTAFAESTLLVIAHRIKTIIDSSRILVLSDGELVEFDTPSALLANPNSHFSRAVDETGEATARQLREMASATAAGVVPASDVVSLQLLDPPRQL